MQQNNLQLHYYQEKTLLFHLENGSFYYDFFLKKKIKKNSFRMVGTKQPMSNAELRCRTIRAEACLLMGFLQLFQVC